MASSSEKGGTSQESFELGKNSFVYSGHLNPGYDSDSDLPADLSDTDGSPDRVR